MGRSGATSPAFQANVTGAEEGRQAVKSHSLPDVGLCPSLYRE